MRPHLVSLQTFTDERGCISVGNVAKPFCNEVPFKIDRFFILHGSSSGSERGGHAHKEQHQFLVCTSGWVETKERCIEGQSEHRLDSPRWALYVPPMTWLDVFMWADSSLLVLSSGLYDEDDYIRDWEAFSKIAA